MPWTIRRRCLDSAGVSVLHAMRRIDLNADLGEECGDDGADDAMLTVVTSASIAAGGHAGGGEVLARTVVAARDAGVAVGAHPSYPDRARFGRVSMAAQLGARGVASVVAEQVAAVRDACTDAGTVLRHVKAHGALYGDVAGDRSLAAAFLDGIERAVDGSPVAVLGPVGTVLDSLCATRGISLMPEGFADRAYRSDGSLAERRLPGSVLTDPEIVAGQAVAIASGRAVPTIDGGVIVVRAASLCLHGDTPGAVLLASVARDALVSSGVRVVSPWS
jgi:UPF0271 protein